MDAVYYRGNCVKVASLCAAILRGFSGCQPGLSSQWISTAIMCMLSLCVVFGQRHNCTISTHLDVQYGAVWSVLCHCRHTQAKLKPKNHAVCSADYGFPFSFLVERSGTSMVWQGVLLGLIFSLNPHTCTFQRGVPCILTLTIFLFACWARQKTDDTIKSGLLCVTVQASFKVWETAHLLGVQRFSVSTCSGRRLWVVAPLSKCLFIWVSLFHPNILHCDGIEDKEGYSPMCWKERHQQWASWNLSSFEGKRPFDLNETREVRPSCYTSLGLVICYEWHKVLWTSLYQRRSKLWQRYFKFRLEDEREGTWKAEAKSWLLRHLPRLPDESFSGQLQVSGRFVRGACDLTSKDNLQSDQFAQLLSPEAGNRFRRHLIPDLWHLEKLVQVSTKQLFVRWRWIVLGPKLCPGAVVSECAVECLCWWNRRIELCWRSWLNN